MNKQRKQNDVTDEDESNNSCDSNVELDESLISSRSQSPDNQLQANDIKSTANKSNDRNKLNETLNSSNQNNTKQSSSTPTAEQAATFAALPYLSPQTAAAAAAAVAALYCKNDLLINPSLASTQASINSQSAQYQRNYLEALRFYASYNN